MLIKINIPSADPRDFRPPSDKINIPKINLLFLLFPSTPAWPTLNARSPFRSVVLRPFIAKRPKAHLLRTQTRCLEENDEKHERERKTRKKNETNREAPMASLRITQKN